MWWPPVSGKAVLYSEADRMPAAPVQKPGRKPGPASVIKRMFFLQYVFLFAADFAVSRCSICQGLVHEHTQAGPFIHLKVFAVLDGWPGFDLHYDALRSILHVSPSSATTRLTKVCVMSFLCRLSVGPHPRPTPAPARRTGAV